MGLDLTRKQKTLLARASSNLPNQTRWSWVALLLHIRYVPGSNLGSDTGFHVNSDSLFTIIRPLNSIIRCLLMNAFTHSNYTVSNG
jgi:hypothetical protein